MSNVEIGRAGEDFAVLCLKAQGFKIIERNYRCRKGEIDIIGEKEGVIHFIEVKTRSKGTGFTPCEAITEKKKEHIQETALFYLSEKYSIFPYCSFDFFGIETEFLENVF